MVDYKEYPFITKEVPVIKNEISKNTQKETNKIQK